MMLLVAILADCIIQSLRIKPTCNDFTYDRLILITLALSMLYELATIH